MESISNREQVEVEGLVIFVRQYTGKAKMD